MSDPFALCEVKTIDVFYDKVLTPYEAYCYGELGSFNAGGMGWAIVLIPTGNLLLLCDFKTPLDAVSAMLEISKISNCLTLADKDDKKLSKNIAEICERYGARFALKQNRAPREYTLVNGYTKEQFQ